MRFLNRNNWIARDVKGGTRRGPSKSLQLPCHLLFLFASHGFQLVYECSFVEKKNEFWEVWDIGSQAFAVGYRS